MECLSAEYAIYALLARPDSLPLGEALAWLAFWVWIPVYRMYRSLAPIVP